MKKDLKRKVIYWGVSVIIAILHYIILKFGRYLDCDIHVVVILYFLLGSVLLLFNLLFGLNIFRADRVKRSSHLIVSAICVSIIFPFAMIAMETIFTFLVMMNGLNEYPQPLTDGLSIVWYLLYGFIACKLCKTGFKVAFPRGRYLISCFVPVILFLLIGVILTIVNGESFMLTQKSGEIIRYYNIYISRVVMDITLSLAVFEMLRYNAGGVAEKKIYQKLG